MSPEQVAAQAGSAITISVEAAFAGHLKYGEWLPVWVELENRGPDLQAEIQIRVTGSGGTMNFTVPVPLPAGARKRVPVYVLPNNYTRELDVQLVSSSGLLASQKVLVNPHPNLVYLIGLVAPDRKALALIDAARLTSVNREKILVDVSLSELPERYEALRSFDCLVINGVDTTALSPRQATALEAWVNQGGRLVIGGGAQTALVTAGFPSSLLPFVPAMPEAASQLETLTGLETYVEKFSDGQTPILIPGPFLVSTGSYQGGNFLASQTAGGASIPLVTEWSLGSGFVDFIALDLNASPFDAWNGAIDFWVALLSPTAVYPPWLAPDISARQQIASGMPYTLTNLPMLDLPSARGLAVLLGVYILVVGPLNYFVLRRRKSLHLAWVTIPIITILFSIGAFALGYTLHGTDLFINKIAVIQIMPGGKASQTSYFGLFSPSRGAYEVEVLGDGLISPLAPFYDPWNSFGSPQGMGSNQEVRMQQSEPVFIRGLQVDQWSMQSFMIEGASQEFGQIITDLRLEGNSLVGTIVNQTDFFLKDVVLLFGKKFTRLGDLPVGGQAEFGMSLTQEEQTLWGPPLSYRIFEDQFNAPGISGVQREFEVKRTILENVFERVPYSQFKNSNDSGSFIGSAISLNQGVVIFGWTDQAPPEVRVAGVSPAQQSTALVYTYASYNFPSSGPVTIPAGMIPGMLTQMPREGGTCGDPSSTAVYLYRGEAVFEFLLPVEVLEFTIKHLILTLDTDSGMNFDPLVSFYNWKTSNWVKLRGIQQGENLIPEAASFVNSDGLVRIQYALSDEQFASSGGCFFLSLGLEATH